MRSILTLLILSLSTAAPLWSRQPVPQAQTAAAQAPATASSLLTPALGRLRETLDNLRIDKWKAPGPVREDASSNIGSLRNDLDATLPPLLAAADAAPASVSKNLPVYRNIEALYDVLLRVAQTADLAAPDEQSQGLQGALGALEDARNALGEALESAAIAQESRSVGLSARVHTLEAAAASAQAAQAGEEAADDKARAAAARRRHHAVKPVAQPQQQ